LPGEKEFGRANLHAQINGQEVQLQAAPSEENSAESGSVWRASLPSAWRQKEKINLALSYDLSAQPPSDPRILVSANTFYLNDSGWFPQLHGFRGLFAASPTRPDPTTLSVIIPADFRVTASGQPRGAKKQAAEVAHQFAIRKTDFDPYILAGQYNEWRVSSANVIFWSAQPLSANLQQPAMALARAAQFYSQSFGQLPRDNSTIYVVNNDDTGDAGEPNVFASFQNDLPATIINGRLTNADFLAAFPTFSVNEDLAATWFTHVVEPHPEAWLLAHGLIAYVAALDDQQHSDGASLAKKAAHWLELYDAQSKWAIEQPKDLMSTDESESAANGLAKLKIALFMVALEDKCGQQNVTHAIHDMVYALRGEQYGYSDFRAALEQQCHQNLADFFRTWLAQPGIPPDFRARYQNAGADKQ